MVAKLLKGRAGATFFRLRTTASDRLRFCGITCALRGHACATERAANTPHC